MASPNTFHHSPRAIASAGSAVFHVPASPAGSVTGEASLNAVGVPLSVTDGTSYVGAIEQPATTSRVASSVETPRLRLIHCDCMIGILQTSALTLLGMVDACALCSGFLPASVRSST